MRLSIPLHLLFHFISILYQTNAFSMTMYPIDSPHLKIIPENYTEQERHQFLRNISLARAFYFNKNNTTFGLDGLDYPLSHISHSYFLAELSVGTPDPPFKPLVVIDFSSDHTWFQCAKCDPCFKLDKPYDPEASITFAKLTLDDDRCNTNKSYEGTCGFESTFGKGHTDGYVGTDTFSFSNTFGERSYFPNIAFGCGIHNKGFNWPTDGRARIAGVHGLGLGQRSFLTQLSDEIQGRFSYCIPREKGQTVITFGDAAKIGKNAGTIGMNPSARYHLNLTSISVQGIPIYSSIFELDNKNSKSGFFMDPNTPITVLNRAAYAQLVAEIIAYFELAFKWIPIPSFDLTELCYIEEPESDIAYPVIGLHFKSSVDGAGEVTLNLPHESVFKKRPFPLPGFCLHIESTGGPSIFGAYQQSDYRFVFDVNAKQLSFAEDNCQ